MSFVAASSTADRPSCCASNQWSTAVGQHRGTIIGDQHPTVLSVRTHRRGDVAAAEFDERLLLPLGHLAAVHGELGDARPPLHRCSEPAARRDFGELAVVAGEEHPAAVGDGRGDECFEVADAGHAGFVDDEQRPPIRSVVPTGPLPGEAMERG